METRPEIEPRRVLGRPRRLRRDQIIRAAIAVLHEADGLAGFSMARVARRLEVTPMALYTYHRSRDDLLEAVARSIFETFEAPGADDRWEDRLLKWMHAVLDLFERYPIALGLVKWDGRLTPSWLHVMLPMVRILQSAGIAPIRLTTVTVLVGHLTLGLVVGTLRSDPTGALDELFRADVDEQADKMLLDALHDNLMPATGRAPFEIGCHAVVDMVKKQRAEQTATSPP